MGDDSRLGAGGGGVPDHVVTTAGAHHQVAGGWTVVGLGTGCGYTELPLAAGGGGLLGRLCMLEA